MPDHTGIPAEPDVRLLFSRDECPHLERARAEKRRRFRDLSLSGTVLSARAALSA
jgi:hypothetical protein